MPGSGLGYKKITNIFNTRIHKKNRPPGLKMAIKSEIYNRKINEMDSYVSRI